MNAIKANILKILLTFTILMSITTPVMASDDVVGRSDNFYVNDTSNVISEEVKTHILTTNKNFEQTSEKPQVVVTTVPTLNNLSIEEYSVNLFEKIGVGNKEFDNGVLVLLATDDREIRIEVGYGLEGAINDSMAGDIIDNNLSFLSNNNFSEAIENIFNNISYRISEEYNYDDSIFDRSSADYLPQKIPTYVIVLISLLVIVLIILDFKYNEGLFTVALIHFLSYASTNNSGSSSRSSGGGGRSGGGGASRRF